MKKYILLICLIAVFTYITPASSLAVSPFDFVNLKVQGLGDITAYEKIKITNAWDLIEQLQPTLAKVVIGIFDTGIDVNHPEFGQVIIDTPTAVDTLVGGHGTQIAGIVGANNLSFSGQYTPPQMNGILSGARNLKYILRIRASSDFGNFTSKDGFSHFVELDKLSRSPLGVNIINGSFGAPLCSELSDTQKFAYKASGKSCYTIEVFNSAKSIYLDLVNQYPNTLFVFTAGNDGINAQFNLPGGGTNVANTITIGATDLDDKRAAPFPLTLGLEESNFGPTVNIAAPGVRIYAPKPNNQYTQFFSGTSASAPLVTGVAGLIKAIKPALTPAQIKQILIANADPIQTDKPIGGRLNALKAVCDPLVGLNCPITPPQLSIWPMLQKNAQRTGLADVAGPPFATSSAVTLKWQKDLSIASNFPPLVGAQAVYVGAGSNLLAFDKTNGNQIWQSSIPAGAVNGALGPDGTIYVCGLNTNQQSVLTAVNPADGSIKWQFQVGSSRPCNDPAVAENGVIFTTVPPPFNTQIAVVVAVNPDGTQKWRHEEGNTATTPPALSNDESQVYVGFRENLKAFNAQSGQILWNQDSTFFIFTFVVVDSGDRVLAINISNDSIMAFSKTGNFLWQNGSVSTMSLYPENKIFATNPGGFKFFNASDGSLISFGSWPGGFQLPGNAFPIVDKDGLIYLPLAIFGNPSQVRLFAFDSNGNARWTFDVPSNLIIVAIGSSALNSDGTLYLLAQGLLFAF